MAAPAIECALIEAQTNVVGHRVDQSLPGVDLWCLRMSDLAAETRADPRSTNILNTSELERYRRFRFQPDRDAFLTRRLLVRGALSQYASTLPQDWTFVANEFGHPSLAPVWAGTGLQFNLSRSGDLAVCVISRGCRIGVDVEDAKGAESIERVAGVLGADEAARLERMPETLRGASFLRYWTLKEAYVKARGVGLSLPVADIQFNYEQAGMIQVTFGEAVNDEPARWRFAQYRLFDHSIVAVAAEVSEAD